MDMLTKNDIKQIGELMDGKFVASEKRMTGKMRSMERRIVGKIVSDLKSLFVVKKKFAQVS